MTGMGLSEFIFPCSGSFKPLCSRSACFYLGHINFLPYCILGANHFGARNMVIKRPSSPEICSTVAKSDVMETIFSKIAFACSWRITSLPLNTIVILTLSFFSINFRICLTFVARSWSLVLGLTFISLIWDCFCFRLVSCFFLVNLYLCFPKSMILKTGGLASDDTSTRSKDLSAAILCASSKGRMPICSPSEPITRIWAGLGPLFAVLWSDFPRLVDIMHLLLIPVFCSK